MSPCSSGARCSPSSRAEKHGRTRVPDEEAERLFRLALRGREEKLGPKHPDTLRTVQSLADYYRSQGRYEDAERLLES